MEVATLVYSLARLQVKWEDLGRVYRTAIILDVLTLPDIAPNKSASKLPQVFEDEDIESMSSASDEEDERGDVFPVSGDFTMTDDDYLNELQRVQDMVFASNESDALKVQGHADITDENAQRFDQQLQQEIQSRRQRRRSSALSGTAQQSVRIKEGKGRDSDSNHSEGIVAKASSEDVSMVTEESSSLDENNNRPFQTALARSVATILYSLVSMKFDPNSRFSYTYLDGVGAVAPGSPQFPLKEKEVRLALLRLMRDSCSFMNSQELGLAMYSLGCLEVNWWTDLSDDFRQKLFSSISVTLEHLDSSEESSRLQVISNLIFGLWKMKVSLVELPAHLRSLLENRIVEELRAGKEVVPFSNLVIFLNSVANILTGKRGHERASTDTKSPLYTNIFRHSMLVAIARSMYSYENELLERHTVSHVFDFSAFSEMSDSPAKDISLLLNILGRFGIDERFLRRYWILQAKLERGYGKKTDFHAYKNSVGLSSREDFSNGMNFTILRLLHVNDSEDTTATQGLGRFNHPLYTVAPYPAGTQRQSCNSHSHLHAFLQEPLLARFYKLISYSANVDMTLQGT